MKRVAVTSSNIRSVGHDTGSNTLEIEFNTGAVYQYPSVSRDTYDQMLAAESVGKFFHANIRMLACTKVSDGRP